MLTNKNARIFVAAMLLLIPLALIVFAKIQCGTGQQRKEVRKEVKAMTDERRTDSLDLARFRANAARQYDSLKKENEFLKTQLAATRQQASENQAAVRKLSARIIQAKPVATVTPETFPEENPCHDLALKSRQLANDLDTMSAQQDEIIANYEHQDSVRASEITRLEQSNNLLNGQAIRLTSINQAQDKHIGKLENKFRLERTKSRILAAGAAALLIKTVIDIIKK